MVIPKELENVLVSTADTLGGSVRFKGTRVPVQALIDTLDAGHGLDYFLEGWPDVTEEQARSVISWEQENARQVFGLKIAS
jgi:uncharacterized protein (DUF433 family)